MAPHVLAGIESNFATEVASLAVPWEGAEAPQPRLLVLNEQLASELGVDVEALRGDDGVAILSGSVAPEGSRPVAMAYAGHQFGGFTPMLGDGRALLLGEIRGADGRLLDVHLKGSGRTPFSRGGDGWAVAGPMLREYLISEAMHALGIPTTRALAVTATGQDVMRDRPEPGAVLTRIASSHLRVGTFEFAVRREGLVQPLADYAIARHYPELADRPDKYLAFFEAVVEAQASLVAHWMLVGFVHGVMNTDNTTVSGQTIDYGPCAFIDAFDPGAVFSSIDHGGRYAYGNQPAVLQWNLARFAETLLPVVSPTIDEAITSVTAVLDTFFDRYGRHYSAGMAAKLGVRPESLDGTVVDDLLTLMEDHRADWTSTFRALADELRGIPDPLNSLIPRADTAEWVERWRALSTGDPIEIADAMDRVNPQYIPRNHLVDAALNAATAGDMSAFEEILDVVTHPFEKRDDWFPYAQPAPQEFAAGFRTFCGT